MENDETTINLAIENLTTILPLLAKNFSRAIRSKTDFTPGVLHTLGALSHHGKLTMSGIGCHLSVPKSHVTALVDRLITDNLVERLYDPHDRRIIYIQLTEKGAEKFKAVKRLIAEELGQKLQLLDKEQLQTLLDSSQRVKDILVGIMIEQHKVEQQSCSGSSSCKDE